MPGADIHGGGLDRASVAEVFGKTSCICFFHVVIIALELERGWEHGDALGAPGAARCCGEPQPDAHKTERPFARTEKRDRTNTPPRYTVDFSHGAPWHFLTPKGDALRLPLS